LSSLFQLLNPPGLSLAASGPVIHSRCTDNAEYTALLLRSADPTENMSRDWRADCWLATTYKHSSCCCVRVSRGVYRAVAWQCVDMSHCIKCKLSKILNLRKEVVLLFFLAGCLLSLLVYPENIGTPFLRNFGKFYLICIK
jgi:hypothetical protein